MTSVKKQDCFYFTLYLMQCHLNNYKNIEKILNDHQITPPDQLNPYLIHGYVDQDNGDTKKIMHAWVEVDEHVIEYSGKNDHVYTVNSYKASHNAEEIKRFTAEEDFEILMAGYSVGFWDDLKVVHTVLPCPTYEELLALDFQKFVGVRLRMEIIRFRRKLALEVVTRLAAFVEVQSCYFRL